MENIKENKKIKYIWRDKKFTRDTINNINHTNINNNINITNYYPSLSQDYCNKETITFINKNGNEENVISYPLNIETNKTKKSQDSTLFTTNIEKKYHQHQSPYMKKILPSSKRQKSEEGNRILYINSPSSTYLKTNKKKKIIKNDTDNISLKNEILKRNNKKNIRENYYLDLSSDEINNKFISNRNNNNHFFYNNSEVNNFKLSHNRKQNKLNFNNNNITNKSIMSYESNGKENILNLFEKPYEISVSTKEPLYRITSNNKNNYITYNFITPKFIRSYKNLNINNKEGMTVNKKMIDYIILIQSIVRGFLLRTKLEQYLYLYERIKKGIFIIQYIIFVRKTFIFNFILNNVINNQFTQYYINSYLTPTNHISLEFKNLNIKNKIISNESFDIKNNNKYYQDIKDKYKNKLKINEINEIEKELNKKKIDFAVAEKKIKELLLENKKIQNINNIIVRDNKQLALKLKNYENNRYIRLEVKNNNFCFIGSSNKKEIKLKINKLLTKIITKKLISIKAILYKYLYKFYLKSKLIKMNQINIEDKNQNLIIQNNNFIINEKENITKKNIINDKDINFKKNLKLNLIIKKKDLNLYICRNVFEKWMLRTLIFKNKDFIKEKKKKKKEKFKQRKIKRMYGYIDKNDKKTNDDENENNDNSMDYSDEYEGEQKYNSQYKYNTNKKNNFFDV